jgi:hypothetical protein
MTFRSSVCPGCAIRQLLMLRQRFAEFIDKPAKNFKFRWSTEGLFPIGDDQQRDATLVDAMREADDPFSDKAVVLRLIAGERQCAMKLLARRQYDVCLNRPLQRREILAADPLELSQLRIACRRVSVA